MSFLLLLCLSLFSFALLQLHAHCLPRRLQRRANPLVRVVGVSDAPERLASPLGALERTARLLRVPRVLLYPRFRDTVKACLEVRPARRPDLSHLESLISRCQKRRADDVVALAVPLTPATRGVQQATLALLSLCVAELRRATGQVRPAPL